MGDNTKEDLGLLMKEFLSLKNEVSLLWGELSTLRILVLNSQKKGISAQREFNKTTISTFPLDKCPFKPLKANILGISIGNKGVPADRQTDRQEEKRPNKEDLGSFSVAPKLLESLDDLRKEIRLKFKQLTEQEFLVFSTIYKLEEETGTCDYKSLATSLGLTESSIRDYVVKLIRKGIPVEKTKLNNKSVILSISKNLKTISTLPTIFTLRNL